MTQEQEQLLVSVFRLANAHFGIPAAKIEEVVQVGIITPVHHAPASVAGIRNLRGKVVTVIDLKIALSLGPAERNPDNRILIVNSNDELVGLLVEAVEDTIFLDPAAVVPAPPQVSASGSAASTRFLYKGGRRGFTGRFIAAP